MKVQKIGFISLMVLVMVFISACGTKSAEELTTIKVALICGGMTPVIAQIGMNDGSFEKAGLNVEKVCFTAGADAINALVGGSVDVNLGSYEHVLKMVQNNLGVKAYGEIFNNVGYSLIVKADSTYQTLADLKGMTLGVTKAGSLSHTGLRIGLEKNGLDPEKDVKVIGAGSGSTMLAAIQGGNVAGGMVSEPVSSQMVEGGEYRILYDPDFDYAGIIVMSKSDWVDKNKSAMKTFLKTMIEINERAQKDPKTAAQAMTKEFENIPVEVLEKAMIHQLALVPGDLKVSQAGAEIVNENAVKLKTIDKAIPYEQAVDLSLLP